MRPQNFVTIDINQGGGGLSRPIIAGALLRVLHGVFKENENKYAIAIPDHGFGWVRVFAGSREDLDLLHENIKGNQVVKDYCRFGYPQAVPEGFSGPWKRYSRFRIPSRNAERNENGTVRMRRIEKAENEQLPYFIVRSKSNGQGFSLHVKIETSSGPQKLNECEPNSYGLSVTTRPFALPDLSG